MPRSLNIILTYLKQIKATEYYTVYLDYLSRGVYTSYFE